VGAQFQAFLTSALNEDDVWD